MTVIEIAAKEFNMRPDELLRESLKSYLEKKLLKVETDIFSIVKKYGIKDVFEFDSKIRNGLLKEHDTYDDYFLLDNLEMECEKIKKLLENI